MTMLPDNALQRSFVPFGVILKAWAVEQPERIAIRDEQATLTWKQFDTLVDRVAAQLQRGGTKRGDAVAIAGMNSVTFCIIFCAAIRIGAVATPLTTSATSDAVAAMIRDCRARYLFCDQSTMSTLGVSDLPDDLVYVVYDGGDGESLSAWIAGADEEPTAAEIRPGDAFNIIYSSGTTGQPKGIVQSHAMRMAHIRRGPAYSLSPESVTIVATPLYSNTSLVSFLPALAAGGSVVLMPRFDARQFCKLAQQVRATHTMLVPVQYQRIMALPDFAQFDLTSFVHKACTSAPFLTPLKLDVLERWPGRLIEIYGMTEGGGTCALSASDHPDKLHTVGRPLEGHDIRLIDDEDAEVRPGCTGEIVGRSEAMMTGYLGQPGKTRDAEWHDSEGRRYIRHGDVGRFDDDGFLILLDRKKDMIISGGFNIYPSDLEDQLLKEPVVSEAAVIGVPSIEWGETPAAFVVLRDRSADPAEILARTNGRLGKVQRIRAIYVLPQLPRNPIGKVVKRDLKERARNMRDDDRVA